MAGFDNDVVYAGNVDFRGVKPVVGQVTTDGQLLIGSTASPNIKVATLTAGAGVTITNGSGSISIAASGGGFTTVDVTSATQTIAISTRYVTNRGGGVTYTLPATATEGDMFKITGSVGLWTIAQNANQSIRIASSTSTVGVGGSVAATNAGDCVTLSATVGGASTVWTAESVIGNLTVV